MDDGKHDILPVAGAILDDARVPVMLPRQSDADMRRDGSTTAQTVPNPPSMSAEECTAPQDSQAGIGSTRWLSSERTASQNSASPDTLETRRRRWPRREKEPRLRGQYKSVSPFGRLLWSVNGLRRAAGKGVVPLFRKSQLDQRELRPPPFSGSAVLVRSIHGLDIVASI